MDTELRIVARVVHARLLPADVHGVFLPAEAFGSALYPVGQCVAEALAPDHFFDQRQDCLCIAPVKLQPVGLLFRQDTVFIAFDRPGDGIPGGDAVHPRPAQHLVELENGVETSVQQQRTEGFNGLVFGLVRLVEARVFPPANVELPAAAERAGVAVVLDRLQAADVRRLIDRFHASRVPRRTAPVFDGTVSAGDGEGGIGVGAPFAEHGSGQGAVHRQDGQPPHEPPACAEKAAESGGERQR